MGLMYAVLCWCGCRKREVDYGSTEMECVLGLVGDVCVC